MPTETNPSLDDLVEAFPPVDRSTLEKITDQIDNYTTRSVADVLEAAAAKGKVPDEPYMQMANTAAGAETLDLSHDDPLDDPPDADPTSPHNEQRGRQAMAHIRSQDYPSEAERVVREGSVSDMVDLLSTVNKWANEALLSPNRVSIPDGCKDASETLGDALVSRIDALAAQGRADELEAAKSAIQRLNIPSLRQSLNDQIEQKLRLLGNSGSDYESVRERVLAETNTPDEVRRLYQDALDNSDITYEQAVELGEDVTEWLREYREIAEEADELEADA